MLLSNNITFTIETGTGRPSKETFPLAPVKQTGGKWECPGGQRCACLRTRHCVQPRSKKRKGRWNRLFRDSLFIYLFSANSQLLKGKVTTEIGRVLISLSTSLLCFPSLSMSLFHLVTDIFVARNGYFGENWKNYHCAQ